MWPRHRLRLWMFLLLRNEAKMKVIVELKAKPTPGDVWTYENAHAVKAGTALEVVWCVDGKKITRGVPMADVKMYEIEES